MLRIFYFSPFILLLFLSCQVPTEKEEVYIPKPHLAELPEPILKMMEFHGGLSTWEQYKLLSYRLEKSTEEKDHELHLIDLVQRRAKIVGSDYELGFDGQDVWVAPDQTSFDGNPVFYYNLYFYFHSLPFLAADPGINYTELGAKTVDSLEYLAVKISYGQDVGNSPEDEYILLLNPDTHRLEKLLYTVTYFSGEKSEKYNGLVYEDWQKVGEVWLPGKITGYTYDNNRMGNKRYAVVFKDMELSPDTFEINTFRRPDVSETITVSK